MFNVTFWGVRGSIPTPGPLTAGVGGNTSCLEVRAGAERIILDAGTGLRLLGNAMMAEGGPVRARMLFTHVHWDHIQGFPFFSPAFVPGNRFDLYGGHKVQGTLHETLSGQMNYPNFPVSLEEMGSQMVFHHLHEGEPLSLGEVQVTSATLDHPGGVYAYRISFQGRSLVYATDNEHGPAPDPRLVGLAAGAELLIYDAMYTPEEYEGREGRGARVGWGHSTWAEGVKVARAAGVERLVLFHHDPEHDDATVEQIERLARRELGRAVAAREGLLLQV